VINDERVQFVPVEGSAWEASPESSLGSQPYRILERTVRQVYGATIPVAPYLVTGATDARRFVLLCPNIYRFTPMIATEADLAGVHGTNERISVEVFGQMVQFMCRLIKNWSEMEGS
jgi:carboxypeptidase PM20D1